MIITDIVVQKRNDKRCSVFIDGDFAFGMSDVDVLYYRLKIGDEISEERYEHILNETIYKNAMDRATNFLGYRKRSEKEVRDKLEKDYSEEITNKVIELLKSYKYIDDESFAISFTNDSMQLKRDGKIKIKYALLQKGISENIIEDVFDKIDFSDDENIIALINKKIGSKRKLDFKEKKKLYGFLTNKGYSYDQISSCFHKLFDDDGFEN